MRGVPDVAGAAGEPGGGLSLVLADGGKTFIVAAAGTSASAPLWGGLIALADQYAHHDLGFVNPAIYRIARSSSYHKAFHDITTGSNTVTIGTVTAGYQAGSGWDPVTGWGSPNAQLLVPLLARLTSRSKTQQDHAAARRVSAERALALGHLAPRRRPGPHQARQRCHARLGLVWRASTNCANPSASASTAPPARSIRSLT